MPLHAALRLRSLALLVSLCTLAAVGLQSVPLAARASGPAPGIAELRALVGVVGVWTGGLAETGKLAERVPLVGSSAGAAVGFPDLVQKAVADQISSLETFDDLQGEKAFDLGGGDARKGTLRLSHTTAGLPAGAHRVGFALSVRSTRTAQPFSLRSESPKVELASTGGVTVSAEATLDFSVVVEPQGGGYAAYLERTSSTSPGFTLAVDVKLPNAAPGLSASLGILGVSLVEQDDAVDASLRLSGSVADPDGDGRLYVTRPDGSDGELRDPAAAVGLWTVGFASPAGSVAADLTIKASGAGFDLGPVSGTVSVVWPDVSTGSPTVSTSGLDPLAAFQRLSPRDVADMLAQLVAVVNGAQRGPQNRPLPLLSGTVADAVKGAEALSHFLTENVVQPSAGATAVDPARVGEPKFGSLQELVSKLNGYSGGTTVPGGSITATVGQLSGDRLPLQLVLSRQSGEVDLVKRTVALSGTATYEPKALTAAGTSFAADLVGRRVTAGSSGGTVAAVSGSTLTLATEWVGGRPEDGTTFAISGAEVDAGVVSFANLLASGQQNIANANAVQPTAKVTPTYTATLKLALDLSAPRTGSGCSVDGGPACPYSRANLDGSRVTVTQEPLPVDRLLVGVGYDLLTARFPMTAAAEVHARAGFLRVQVGGTVKVCSTDQGADCTGTSTQPMVKVELKKKPGEQDYVPVVQLFSSLVGDPATIATRIGVTTNVRAHATGSVSVPDAAQFLGGGSAGFTATWPDITAGGPSVTPDAGLTKILAFDLDTDDPRALLGVVVRALQLLDEQLQAGGGSGVLGAQVPLLDTSLRDLLAADEGGIGSDITYTDGSTGSGASEVLWTDLRDPSRTGDRAFSDALVGRSVLVGTKVAVVLSRPSATTLRLSRIDPAPARGTPYTMRTELSDAISLLTASPPDSVQELVRVLDRRLSRNTPLSFSYSDALGTPHLVVRMDWKRVYSRSTPIAFQVGGKGLAGTAGDGAARVTVRADVKAGLAIPLAVPAGGVSAVPLKVLDDSSVTVDATASVDGTVRANLGPLALSLGKPGGTVDEQAKAAAHYRLGLSKAGGTAGTASTLSAFLSAAAVEVNDYTGGVSCGSGFVTGGDLALCANLPLYVTSNGTTWQPLFPKAGEPAAPDPAKGSLRIRLPKTGESAAELFTPTGTVGGGNTQNRVDAPTPGDIATAFADSLLDIGTIGDGLDAFLLLVQDSLTAASLEGKLPVVGSDLQAGADFVGGLRTELATLFAEIEEVNGGKLPDAGQVRTYLDGKLTDALRDAKADPKNLSLAFTCVLKPSDVTGATAVFPPDDGADPPVATPTASYEYAVVAVGTVNGAAVETVLGTTKTVTGAKVLGGAAKNTVTWASSDNATGYKVVRRTDGAAWQLVGTVGAVTTFDDTSNSGAAYTPKTTEPTVDSCDGASITDVEGIVLRVDIGVGTISGADGCSGCLETEIPLDPGLPGLTLKKADGSSGGVTGKLGWKIHLAVSLDKADGFSLLTKDQGLPEVGVGVALDVVDPLKARLAFIDVDLSKAAGATAPAFAAAFQIDLASGTPASEPSCYLGTEGAACTADLGKKLTLAKLSSTKAYSDLVRPRLDLRLNVDWLLKARADAALPGIQTRLVMSWNKVISTSSVSDATLDTDLAIGFQDVSLDVGAFLNDVLEPVVKQLKSATGPLQPVVDTLYAPIPVLSDLSQAAGGPPVTLVTLAKTFSTLAGGPNLSFVDTVAGVTTFVNNIPDPSGGPVLIPIGSFTLKSADTYKVKATPDSGTGLVKAKSAVSGDSVKTTIDQNSTKPALKTGVAKNAGISFPLVDDPGQVFDVIMGGDVTLVEFDSGPLSLGFTWRQAFGPVYAPPPVFITLSGSASVTAHIVAGFDTFGLRKFVEDPSGSTAVGILNGLYFKTAGDDGVPIPVVKLYGEIAAGAAVSVVAVTVGVEGGVSLTVAFLWNDPNADGKFRLFEFGRVALSNPVCLFQTSGRLALFLRAYVTLGISPFSVSFSFTLADLTLLDFDVEPDCEPPPPVLGGVSQDGTTLVLFAGKLGTGANRGDAAWDNAGDDETVKVIQTHDYASDGTATPSGVKVQMLGVEDVWSGAVGKGIQRVVVDGRGHGQALQVAFLGDGDASKTGKAAEVVPSAQFSLEAVVLGGSGDDVVKTGTGRSTVSGGLGNDTITASDAAGVGTTRIAGGPGDDSITTGDADAVVAGDSALGGIAEVTQDLLLADNHQNDDKNAKKSVSGIVAWGALTDPGSGEAPTDGSDRIAVGRGTNTAYGNGKDDAVGVGTDSPLAGGPKAKTNTIVLGSGSDTAKGGSGDDTVWTGERTTQVRGTAGGAVDGDGGADPGARNNVDTGAGDDTVFGGAGDDWVQSGSTSSQRAFVTGGAGSDVLLGGLGADDVFGGPGEDWVVAEPAGVGGLQTPPVTGQKDALGTFVRTYAKTPLPAGTTPSAKLLVGGDGADRVVGGDGSSRIFGDRYEDVDCAALSDSPESQAPAEPGGGAPGRDLITGGAGVDRIKAGGQADLVRSLGGDDLVCGQAGADELLAGDGADVVWAGSGGDRAYGEAGSDRVYGNDDTDQLYGGADVDVLEGNGGSDRADGGADDDVVLGGTRSAGAVDAGDVVYGGAGRDVVLGDNGDGTSPYDLDGSSPSAGGPDTVYGGDGRDAAYGGLANDSVLGGPGDDHLEGNLADDQVFGEDGEDQLLGGSTQEASTGTGRADGGDQLSGQGGNDLLVGDNARLSVGLPATPLTGGRGFVLAHALTVLDLGDAPLAANSGVDTVRGGVGNDVVVAGGKGDVVLGDEGDDHLEGNSGRDTVSGGAGDDDVVGGSSTATGGSQPDAGVLVGAVTLGDVLAGDDGHDLLLGDNGDVLRDGTPTHPVTKDRGVPERAVSLLDLGSPVAAATRYGDDAVTGGEGKDVVFGQAGDDELRGGLGDDYLEGDQGSDRVFGDEAADDLVGGSSTAASGVAPAQSGQPDAGDVLTGGSGGDVITGDNAAVLRTGPGSPVTNRPGMLGTLRTIVLQDLGDAPQPGRSGGDTVTGDEDVDVVLGQGGDDVLKGGLHDDYVEGGPGGDLLEGNDGQDDLVGGSSALQSGSGDAALGQPDAGDHLYGGADEDLVLGDNAVVLRSPGIDPGKLSALTSRYAMTGRSLRLLDQGVPGGSVARAGGDRLSGGTGPDVLLGQDSGDRLSGGPHEDWLEGNGGADTVFGDQQLADPVPVELAGRLSAAAPLLGTGGADGQDELVGGSSNLPSDSSSTQGRAGFRDGADSLFGDGESDFALGDNGTLFRDPLVDGAYPRMAQRYDVGDASPSRAIVRHALRLDVGTGGATSGGDSVQGNGGEDFLWGQDGNDTMSGNDGDDELIGELGDDVLSGDAGQDAVLGDRGGIVSRLVDGSPGDPGTSSATLAGPPAETFTWFRPGTLDRRVDQLHDNAAHASATGDVATFASAALASNGIAAGGADRIRGGPGRDSLHGERGDDLLNGDSGGDAVFGGDGSDVLWGGKGCEPALGECPTASGTPDLSARGADDRFVDHLVGGNGGLPNKGTGGTPELLDFRPRGSTQAPGTTCSTSLSSVTGGDRKNPTMIDPCVWFEMTSDAFGAPASDHQHHQGTDWMYGGWDRDVMEGDVAANGPNLGDRLIDWTGAVNLYNHCNAAYGGFNDVRQFSPDMQTFLQRWAFGLGAGPTLADVTDKAGSGFNELGLVLNADVATNSGSAYPSTPGNFTQFSCAP